MRCANPRAGLHGHHTLHRHGQVDDDAVALLHTLGLQHIGQAADALQQFAVGDFGDFAVVSFENDGDFATQACLDMTVQAVVGHIQQAVIEPLVKGRLAVVKRLAERFFPTDEFARQAGPIAGVVGIGFSAKLIVGFAAANVSTLRECLGNRVGRGGDVVRCGGHGIGSDLPTCACGNPIRTQALMAL